MPASSQFVPPMHYAYPSLAAATYLTWSAMVWTALLMEEQLPVVKVAPVASPQLQIGAYSVGNSTDINLYGHPDIRY